MMCITATTCLHVPLPLSLYGHVRHRPTAPSTTTYHKRRIDRERTSHLTLLLVLTSPDSAISARGVILLPSVRRYVSSSLFYLSELVYKLTDSQIPERRRLDLACGRALLHPSSQNHII